MIGVDPVNVSAKAERQIPCLSMRPREAAKALGISQRLLWDWARRGIVPRPDGDLSPSAGRCGGIRFVERVYVLLWWSHGAARVIHKER